MARKSKLLDAIDRENLPVHIAIIMDGNGRWAKRKGLPRIEGHRAALKSIRAILEGCRELETQVLTLYAFSMENWKRPKDEVDALMELLVEHIASDLDLLMEHDIRLVMSGRKEGLPPEVREQVEMAVDRTSSNGGAVLNVALNYSGRAEIVDAARALARTAVAGDISWRDIDEDRFAQHLYAPDLPDPDLLIRTSGEWRLSNFLLWQISYSEIYVTKVLFPDFRTRHMYRAVLAYQGRERRFGGVC